MKKFDALINNEMISTKNTIITKSVITGENIVSVPALSKDDIDLAYKTSHDAFISWRLVKLENKIYLFEKLIEEMQKLKKDFIYLLENEIYKNSNNSLDEFNRTIDLIRHSIWDMRAIQGEFFTGDSWGIDDKLGVFLREPLGVTLAISPFNYPLNLAMSKLVPAILTGNTVVFKPATFSAGIGCLIGKAFKNAGFPAGVINVVTGRGSEIGDYLITNPLIKLINFTGSTEIGKRISKLSPETIKIFELGGKDAAIVLDDADLEKATKEIISGAFSYNGQRCTAIKRILVTKKTASKLIPMLVKEISNIKIGLPKDNTTITPLVDPKTIPYLQELINDALESGAKVLIGNKIINNHTFAPTLIDNVSLKSKLAWDEPFGPILPIIYCKDIADFIKVTNDSQYGLQASIFTQNIDMGYQIAKKLDVGTINLNSATKRGPDHFPFLGVKESGIGTQGIRYSLYAYTRPKGIIFNFSKYNV